MNAVLLLLFYPLLALGDDITIQVSPVKHSAMQIAMLVQGKNLEIIDHAKKALEFTQQFAIEVHHIDDLPRKSDIEKLWKEHIPYVLFLNVSSELPFIEMQLYNTKNLSLMIGKKIKRTTVDRALGYAIADLLWPILTGVSGFFSQKIAYCKDVTKHKKVYKHIFIADFDGSHEQCLVDSLTLNVVPRWNNDSTRPLLFFSEHTNSNVRLMATTMKKEKIVASSFDGLNMQATFSPDGRSVAYCASRGSGTCDIYVWRQKQLQRLTQGEENNIWPIFGDDDKTVFFVKNQHNKNPYICMLTLPDKTCERITPDGYCVSPAYHSQSKKLAYSKLTNGIMQLWIYDVTTKKHQQLTFDSAQKEECQWSLCGNFLLCPVTTARSNRIAWYNIHTKEYTYVTGMKDSCSYPTLSTTYQEYPVIRDHSGRTV